MSNSLRFITGIRYYKDVLQRLNNMTYIYDVNWNPNNTNKATFPVAFFHVKDKGYHEIMSSEVSQKQMLFYNSKKESTATESDPELNSGLLNVVADNIVIKPKTYKLDVVIPYHNLSLLDQSFMFNTHTSIAVTEALLNSKPDKSSRYFSALSTLSTPYIKYIRDLISLLINQNYNFENFDLTSWVQDTVQQPDYNKQSLEIMWNMRHIVKMKVWNSWEYKYVAIVDMDITKEGTEDGVYEATLTLQEMPIVTMYPQNTVAGKAFTRKNPLLQLKGDVAITLLDSAGGESSLFKTKGAINVN